MICAGCGKQITDNICLTIQPGPIKGAVRSVVYPDKSQAHLKCKKKALFNLGYRIFLAADLQEGAIVKDAFSMILGHVVWTAHGAINVCVGEDTPGSYKRFLTVSSYKHSIEGWHISVCG